MSSITSGVGLISGLPTAELIDSIIESASRPKAILTTQLTKLQAQRTSLTELNARLLSLKTTVGNFAKSSFFNQFAATSSNESILKATASEGAQPGVIDLMVKSLVTSHQMISGGFADANTTPVGSGEITIEFGNARVNPPTRLGDLNGGAGIRRGTIRITDRAGASADIDLSAAVDVQEVIEAINANGTAQVEARVSGNHLVIEDISGGTGTMTVADLRGGFAATDLGIRGSVAGAELVGSDIVKLTDDTLLTALNDGNGIRRNGAGANDFSIATNDGGSFNVALSVSTLKDSYNLDVLNSGNGARLGIVRVTNRLGQTGTVDLSGARTVGEVKELFNAAVDEKTGEDLNVELKIGVGISGVAGFSVEDHTEPAKGTEKELVIEDVSGYGARDLGIAQSTSSATFLGNGVYRITTIGDVVRAINHADGNNGTVVAELTADGIRLTDNTGGTDGLTITGLPNTAGRLSRAAEDLGISGTTTSGGDSRPLIGGLNTVLLSSLNGGNGLELGSVSFTPRGGSAVTVDFTGAVTLQDVIEKINDAVPGIRAEVNSIGTGIALVDTSGVTSGEIMVADVGGGTLAEQLGLAGSSTEATIRGVNLQRRYLGESSTLKELNAGRGVRAGTMRFTTSDERIFTVQLKDSARTLGDVIDAINAVGSNFNVTAALNATGDGIAITDANGGDNPLTIEDVDGGSTAADLRLAGESAYGESTIDGSYEIRVQVDADDTLNSVAGKIRDASQDVTASVFNDGASGRPYRLSVNSTLSGRRGELLFDVGETGLDMSTLVAAQDAVVLVGGRDATNPIVISSSTNTITGAIPGVELNLTSVSDETVTVSTARDIDGIVESISKFVDDHNAVMDRIDEVTSYDAETEQRGILLGDATVSLIEQRLTGALISRFSNAPAAARTMAAVGIELGDGARLTFDEDKFREAYDADPAAVTQLFTGEGGVGEKLSGVLEDLTAETTGVLARKDATIGDQVEDLNERIADQDARLKTKREQLERQYANLESVLAGLQDQQSALTQLAALVN